jgi:pimeloyl-ACP methyl ester carboxylesterase
VLHQVGTRKGGTELLGQRPVRGDAPVIEHASLAEHERARAQRDQPGPSFVMIVTWNQTHRPRTRLLGYPAQLVIIGHSAGGAFTQILLDHGFGAAGVALNSAPTEGVKVVPLSQVKSTFPVLKNPANRHRAVGLTAEQWRYAFTNTFTEEESLALYERYHIPANGGILWGSVLANFQPGPQETWVDYHNDNRAPLLFVSGSEDHIMPPSIQQSNKKHYKSKTVTEIREYEGYAHLLPAQKGWEEIADDVLAWAVEHSR